MLQSTARLYSLFDRPRLARWAVVALLAIHTGLLAYSAYVHSPTLNEPGHLTAGLSHWKFGRFELYRVNPPLVRMVAALPPMAAGIETDWNGFYEGPGARPVFSMGEDLIAANGHRSFDLFMIARWACIPFTWIGAIVCFLWARDLYGPRAGLLATTLWCFSPNILAHASLITADAPATALGLAACYTFWRWLRKPTWKLTLWTGLVLGVAELTKSTLVIFYPLWPVMWLLYRLPDRSKMAARDWLREGAMLVARIAVCVYVVNLGYGFEGSGTHLGEFQFVSNMLTGNADEQTSDSSNPQSAIHNPQSDNRFDDTWLVDVPVPFPKNYILGIDVQRRDFEDYGRPSYLRGEWRDHGWWYYYLYALAIKVPLGTWILLLLVIVHRLFRRRTCSATSPSINPHSAIPNPQSRDELILLFPATVILTFVSSQTGFSEHMRYVLPCFPFIFVWIGSLGKNKFDKVSRIDRIRADVRPVGGQASEEESREFGRTKQSLGFRRSRLATVVAGVALVWSVGSSLWIYPHSLSYFNESVGGPENGHKHLLGSNLDWGQDLRYLKWWLEEHPEAKPLGLVSFGLSDPSQLGLIIQTPSIDFEDSRLGCCFKPNRGWHAISLNPLMGYPCLVFNEKGVKVFFDYENLCDFRRRPYVTKLGFSIVVFKIQE